MITGVGTDFLEISRIQKMLDRHQCMDKIFTKNELIYANDDAATLAGNFAVKEAVSKVFGTGFFGVEPYEIEVWRNEKGAPYVKLFGGAKELAKEQHIHQIHVSITNTDDYVQAFAVGECL